MLVWFQCQRSAYDTEPVGVKVGRYARLSNGFPQGKLRITLRQPLSTVSRTTSFGFIRPQGLPQRWRLASRIGVGVSKTLWHYGGAIKQ
jgi:hypothetical protein